MRYVTCGRCGYPIGTHSTDRLDRIACRCCGIIWDDECDCPDYLYKPDPGELKKHRAEAREYVKQQQKQKHNGGDLIESRNTGQNPIATLHQMWPWVDAESF